MNHSFSLFNRFLDNNLGVIINDRLIMCIYICIGLVYTIFASYFNCSLYHRFWKRVTKTLIRQLFIIRNPISFIVHRSYIYHPSYWNSFFYGSFMRFLKLIVVNEDNDRNGMFQFHLGELHVARETRITFFFCRELKLKLKLKSKAYVI